MCQRKPTQTRRCYKSSKISDDTTSESHKPGGSFATTFDQLVEDSTKPLQRLGTFTVRDSECDCLKTGVPETPIDSASVETPNRGIGEDNRGTSRLQEGKTLSNAIEKS